MRLKGLISSIVDFFFTKSCEFCGAQLKLPETGRICANCRDEILPLSHNNGVLCKYCSAYLYQAKDDICFDCLHSERHFLKNSSLFDYKHPYIKQLVHEMKFESNKSAASDLSLIIKNELLSTINEITYDIITIVPLSKKGRQERGYNQVSLILEKIGVEYRSLLKRDEHEKHQSRMGAAERRKKIKGQFTFLPEDETDARNKKLLLIDDIFTTGSTVDECSRILIESGAQSVEVVTFFRA